jgi:hypothetical protein
VSAGRRMVSQSKVRRRWGIVVVVISSILDVRACGRGMTHHAAARTELDLLRGLFGISSCPEGRIGTVPTARIET